jgi:hypothetical protein
MVLESSNRLKIEVQSAEVRINFQSFEATRFGALFPNASSRPSFASGSYRLSITNALSFSQNDPTISPQVCGYETSLKTILQDWQ